MGDLSFLHRTRSLSRVAQALDQARACRIDDLLARRADLVREARRACAALGEEGRERAIDALDGACRALLGEMRDDPDAGGSGARAIDEAIRRDGSEVLDRAGTPESLRRHTMAALHRLNERLGSYEVFGEAVQLALETGASRSPARVVDLAAGTGGFARWLAANPPPGRPLRLTSTDLRAEYVAMGRDAARRDGLDVAFETADATDLRGARDVDLYVCTQAAHHLSAGLVAAMIAQAVRAAPCGILILDLARSFANLLATSFLVPLLVPHPVLVWDGVLSVRRSYTAAELALLARLAGAERVDAGAIGTAFLRVHARGVRPA